MKSWRELCAEPCRLKERHGQEIFRFINEDDYRAIQADALSEAAKIALSRIENISSLSARDTGLADAHFAILDARDKLNQELWASS